MTKRDVLSLAFKILGVIILAYTIVLIPNIGMTIGMLYQTPSDSYQPYMQLWYFVITISLPVISFVMACILLKWGDKIAARLVKEDKEISAKVGEDWDRRIFVLSLRIIGVICLVRGIVELVRAFGELAFQRYVQYSTLHLSGGFVSVLVLLIIGVYFVVSEKPLVRFAFRERGKASNNLLEP